MNVADTIAEYLATNGPTPASDIQHNCNLTKGQVQYALRKDARFQQGEAAKWSVKPDTNPHKLMLDHIEERIQTNIKEQQELGAELKELRIVSKYHRSILNPKTETKTDTPFTIGLGILSKLSTEPLKIKNNRWPGTGVIVTVTGYHVPIKDQMHLQDLKWTELGRTNNPVRTIDFIYYFE